MSYDWLSFTTDYGLYDGFVATCVGVIATIVPQARVIDVTHAVPAGDIRRGATVLAHTVAYLPIAVHLAVVDPGVGTARRGLAITAGKSILVGPDNGLLLPAADALGGATTAHELVEPAFWLPTAARTFHGRDVFAPVAAHLAAGVEPAALGPELAVTDLVRLPRPRASVHPGELTAEVLTIDHFGNVALAATAADLAAAGASHGDRVDLTASDQASVVAATVGGTFADVPAGEAVVLIDSAGLVAIAVNKGSAAQCLQAAPGTDVTLTLVST